MWRRRLDLTLKPLLQLDSAHTKDFSAEMGFVITLTFGLGKKILHCCWCVRLWISMLAYDGKVFLQMLHDFSLWLSFVCRTLPLQSENAMRFLWFHIIHRKAYFFIRILFDMASSVSVWVLWTCRTQSAGVAKWMFSQRSHDRMLMFSVFSSCWNLKETEIIRKTLIHLKFR